MAPDQSMGFNPTFTQSVIAATGPAADDRIRTVFASLIEHLHDFMRENLVTLDELLKAIEMINQIGRKSDSKRDEGLLMADILGLEVLADEISSRLASPFHKSPTESAVIGPFYTPSAPIREMGDSIVISNDSQGETAWVHGVIRDFKTGKPIPAELDIWMAAPNGMYEGQDSTQPAFNLRGRFKTGEDGSYDFVALRPTPYAIPMDGPAGKLLNLLDRHAWRPAHIHFKVSSPGYQTLVTQVFDRSSKYCENDAVFAVKDSLIVDFVASHSEKASFELEYDFHLPHLEDVNQFGLAKVSNGARKE